MVMFCFVFNYKTVRNYRGKEKNAQYSSLDDLETNAKI